LKIPTLDGPRQQLRPRTEDNQALDVRGSAGGFLAQGLEQAGAAVAKVGDAVEAVRQRAAAIAAQDELNGFAEDATSRLYGKSSEGDGVTSHRVGFLEMQGREAVEASAGTLEELAKLRDQRAAKLAPEARSLFMEHSAQALQGYHRQVESHAGQEFRRAQVATLQATKATALDAIANNFADPAFVADQLSTTEAAVRRLQLSPEAGAAEVADFRSKATATRLEQYLAAKDWRGAQALFSQSKDELAGAAPKYQRAIEQVALAQQADESAASIATANTKPDGRVDLAKADAELEKVAAGPMRDEVRQRLHQRVIAADQAWEQETKRISALAYAEFNVKGWAGVDPRLKAQLNERNPPLYDRLRDDAERRWKQHQGSRSAARQEQRDINRQLLEEFRSLPIDEQYQADLPQLFGGRGADELGMATIAAEQRKAKNTVDRGFSSDADAFRTRANAAAQGITTKRSQDAFKAEATNAFNQWVDEHKRPPTLTETDAIIGKLLSPVVVPGLLWDSQRPSYLQSAEARKKSATEAAPAAPTTAAPAPAAKPSKLERARALKAQGKSNADIATILNSEGY